MADLPKTIKINELPEATSIKDTDIFIIEDGSVTHKITGKKLLEYFTNHGDISNYYVQTSSIGASSGVAPLDSNKKVSSANLNFGTTSGTIYDGAKGKALEDSWDAHLLDTDSHHTHANKSVLDNITQAKINAWDAGTGNGGGVVGATSLEDLGVTATATELNYVDGVTSNIQAQLNALSTSIGSKADTNHTQSASTITGGVLGGQVSTPEGTDYDTNRVRNIVFVTADPFSGTNSTYVNGTIICVYE